MLLWILGHSVILENEYADDIARKGFSSPILNPKPANSVSPCAGWLRVKEWLKERDSEP
jgi:ribonuclease HI